MSFSVYSMGDQTVPNQELSLAGRKLFFNIISSLLETTYTFHVEDFLRYSVLGSGGDAKVYKGFLPNWGYTI